MLLMIQALILSLLPRSLTPPIGLATITALFKKTWGGRRKGAGAKRKPGSGVSHLEREDPKGRPVHVTVKLRRGLPRLRNKKAYRLLRDAFVKGCDRFGFRLCQYSVQNNHLHLIVEGEDRVAISRGMQGLLIRIAKGLNRIWGRRGRCSRTGTTIAF